MNRIWSRAFVWALFVIALLASTLSGTVLDGWQADAVSYAGLAVSLVAGGTIAQQPRIKAFLGATPTLWFLFLFNGAVAAVLIALVGGTTGYAGGGFMTLVSLGAAGGLLSAHRSKRSNPSTNLGTGPSTDPCTDPAPGGVLASGSTLPTPNLASDLSSNPS